MSVPAVKPVGAAAERPLRDLLAIAAPSIATMTSYTVMQFVDTLMVSRITPADPVYVAAAGNGGVWAWTALSIAMGVTGMVNTFVSQHLGAGQAQKAPAYAWNALWLSGLWALILVPLAVWYEPFLRFQSALLSTRGADGAVSPVDGRMIALATDYGQVLLYGAVITMCARTLSQFFYGLHRPRVVLVAAIAGNLTNLVANYLLIYGSEPLGVPKLGVQGAAIATVIGTAVELVIPLCLFLGPRLNAELGTRGAWRPSVVRLKELFKAGWAPALMHGNEMICWALFMSGLVGSFGINHNAASWIVLRYMHMSFMPAVGISFAITAMVGKAMGAGDPELAARRAWLGVKLAMGYMACCALVMAVFREPLVGLLIDERTDPATTAEIVRIGSWIMVVAACFQLFDALGISLVGALRGAGDTVVPGVVTMILAWTLIIGLGLVMVHALPGLGAVGPWIAAAVYIIVFGLWAGYRFWRGAWKKIKLVQTGDAHP